MKRHLKFRKMEPTNGLTVIFIVALAVIVSFVYDSLWDVGVILAAMFFLIVTQICRIGILVPIDKVKGIMPREVGEQKTLGVSSDSYFEETLKVERLNQAYFFWLDSFVITDVQSLHVIFRQTVLKNQVKKRLI